MLHSWFHWLRRSVPQRAAKTRGRGVVWGCGVVSRPRHNRRRSSVPQFLVLEDRTVLSVLTVLNNADSGAG